MSKVINTSGLKPLGCAVLVEPYEPEIKASVIALPDSVKDRLNTVEQRVKVIAVGPHAWHDEPARAAPGDKVLVAKFSGHMCKGTADGKDYRVVNDRDIFLQIETEASSNE